MARSLRGMQAGRALRVTRTIRLDDWLDGEPSPEFTPGMIVHEYKGATYGCITPAGVAVTLEPGRTPFYELPQDAVEDVTDLVRAPEWIREANRARALASMRTSSAVRHDLEGA